MNAVFELLIVLKVFEKLKIESETLFHSISGHFHQNISKHFQHHPETFGFHPSLRKVFPAHVL